MTTTGFDPHFGNARLRFKLEFTALYRHKHSKKTDGLTRPFLICKQDQPLTEPTMTPPLKDF